MLSPLRGLRHSMGYALRFSRYNLVCSSKIKPSLSQFFTTESGKTEKVRTPNLNEINREDDFGAGMGSRMMGEQPTSGPDGEKTPTDQSAEVIELKKEIDILKKRLDETDEKYKRALAEAENTRSRMRRQIDDAKVYGIQNFCKDLLEVADILHIALNSVPEEEVKDEKFKTLFEGVEMTEKQLQSVFRRHGLDQINPLGSKFDPNEHHALYEVEDGSKEPGTVANVTKIGYKLKDRTIRPAMVGVVKMKS